MEARAQVGLLGGPRGRRIERDHWEFEVNIFQLYRPTLGLDLGLPVSLRAQPWRVGVAQW